jgi:hypothetical protein
MRVRDLTSLLLILLVLGGAAVAQPQPTLTGLKVETLLDNGPPGQRIDLVFCGDGFRHSERAQLKASVSDLLGELWRVSPFGDLKWCFNVHLVYLDAPSGERVDGRRTGDFVLGSYKDSKEVTDLIRLRYPERVDKVVANAPACDVAIVVTRMDGRSHAGRHVLISEPHKTVLAHEFGHQLAQLGDEYNSASLLADRESRPLPREGDLPHVNLTLSAFIDPSTPQSIMKTAKWGHFLKLPDGDVVSAFQGGYYRVVDVWRPSGRCIMSESTYPYFCPVCHEHLYSSLVKQTGRAFDHDRYHRDYPLSRWKK